MNKPLSIFHPITIIATVFWTGKSPIAPGTVGSVAGCAIFVLCHLLFGAHTPETYILLMVITTILLYVIGEISSNIYSKRTQKSDPKEVVIDEVAGQMITLLPTMAIYQWHHPDLNHHTPYLFLVLPIGFLFFRLFDIWKPWHIGWCDQNIKGGRGIMMDDVVAGLYASLCTWLASTLLFKHGITYL